MRTIKFRVYTEIRPEVLGMKYFDLSDTSERNDTIMQFTGLLDKQGKEIYEGDIVKNQFDKISEVKFETEEVGSCGCCYETFRGSGFIYRESGDVEIIGNIYENPELLN